MGVVMLRSESVWRLDRGVPLTPSPLLVGDELYLVTDNGIATCVDAKTGQELWRDWAATIPLRRLMPTEKFTF